MKPRLGTARHRGGRDGEVLGGRRRPSGRVHSSPRSLLFFFFSSRRRHTRSLRGWSSDVCSSDLEPGGFKARVVADIRNYGIVLQTTGSRTNTFSLASTSREVFPAGATATCGALVFAGRNTSCSLARKVLQIYVAKIGYGAGTVTAADPSSGKTYVMRCTNQSPNVCTGIPNALVEFYPV